MDSTVRTVFEFARETTKQLITLSTGIIAIEITFLRDAVSALDNEVNLYVQLSWLSFLLCVMFGVWTLMALTGSLASMDEKELTTIYGSNVRLPSMLQILAFICGLVLTVIFGFKAY